MLVIGRVGGGEMGTFSLRSLKREGIDVADIEVVEGAASQFALILVDASTGERTIIWRRDERLAISPDKVPLKEIRRGRYLLLDGHDAPAAAVAAEAASKVGVQVVVDAETVKPGTQELVQAAHYVVCAEEFPFSFTGKKTLQDALEKIQKMGPKCVVSTLGREGALGLLGDQWVRSRGFRVQCVDSTGAGDVFHGAFIYGLANSWGFERVLDFSNAAAALNCTALGARGGIRPAAEILDLISTGARW